MIFMTPLIKYNLRFEQRTAKVRVEDVLVNTFKLVGNSIYGKAATNKETQTDADARCLRQI